MKKALLLSLLTAMLICVFAITTSAEAIVPEWAETQTISSITAKEGFDTTSRVLLSNGDGTYTTYPTYYIIKGNDTAFSGKNEFDFSQLGSSYTVASIVRIEVPEGFKTIENNAFRYDFTSLLTCKIPEGVTTFGSYTFYKNNIIVEVELPNTLTALGLECFFEATALKKVSVGSNTEISTLAFNKCTSLETVNLAEGITTIGEKAFHTTTSLTEISIPSTVTSIGSYAFFNSAISSVTIPNASLGTGAFENCKSLEKAVVLANKISDRTFVSCSKLSVLVLSDNLETISGNPLSGVSKTLLTIYTGSDASKLGTLYNNDIFTKADQITYEQYKKDVTNNVTYSKATIVYNANRCDVLNNGIHAYTDPSSCVAVCINCNLAKEPSLEDHKLKTTYTYANGFASNGKRITKCTVDGCAYSEEVELPALFTCRGYSAPLNGSGSVTLGFALNRDAINAYSQATGKTLEYGVFAVAQVRLGDNDVLNADGTETAGVIKADVSKIGFDFFEIKITGFETDDQKDAKIAMGAYVIATKEETKEISYIQESEALENEKYNFVSYNDIVG